MSIEKSFSEIKAAIHLDPEYAWAWHFNLSVPIMDVAGVSLAKANQAAALIMAQMFDYDITTARQYIWGKSPVQGYFEIRKEADKVL